MTTYNADHLVAEVGHAITQLGTAFDRHRAPGAAVACLSASNQPGTLIELAGCMKNAFPARSLTSPTSAPPSEGRRVAGGEAERVRATTRHGGADAELIRQSARTCVSHPRSSIIHGADLLATKHAGNSAKVASARLREAADGTLHLRRGLGRRRAQAGDEPASTRLSLEPAATIAVGSHAQASFVRQRVQHHPPGGIDHGRSLWRMPGKRATQIDQFANLPGSQQACIPGRPEPRDHPGALWTSLSQHRLLRGPCCDGWPLQCCLTSV